MSNNENVHCGHRKRMRELVNRVGLENLNEIQALEFTLSYVIPRKDTNTIAHDLLKIFGSYANVINAPVKELEKVANLGVDSAIMLSQMKNIFEYYKVNKQKAQKIINNIFELNKYFKNLLEHCEKENVFVIALNEKGTIIATRCLASGSNKLVTLEKRDLADFAFTNKVHKIAMGHNHPVASCAPSKSDDECTIKIKEWLNALGVELVDHVIIGNDGSFSFREVKFFTLEELQE